jgi:hypothetical protein
MGICIFHKKLGMIGTFKQWLGIEGVKVVLEIPEETNAAGGSLEGMVHLFSKHTQVVEFIRVVLIERYSRGRGKERLIDEYELGEATIQGPVEVPGGGEVTLPFSLPFQVVRSDAEEWGRQNLVFQGLTFLASRLRNVRSEYRVEAQAKVRGTVLDPFDKQVVTIRSGY